MELANVTIKCNEKQKTELKLLEEKKTMEQDDDGSSRKYKHYAFDSNTKLKDCH